jgi:hypothetical protein
MPLRDCANKGTVVKVLLPDHHRLIAVQNLRLCPDERQHPALQVQMHVRGCVPLLYTVPLDAMLPEFFAAQTLRQS